MESLVVRPHQNRRRKLEEYLQPARDQELEGFVNPFTKYENLQIFHKVKHYKHAYTYDETYDEAPTCDENSGDEDNKDHNKPIRIRLANSKKENVEKIYGEINAYLNAIHAENQEIRKIEETRSKYNKGDMIIEDCSIEPERESNMVMEEIDEDGVGVQEFYEYQNKLLYELWISRNNVIREE